MRILLVFMVFIFGASLALGQVTRRDEDGSQGGGRNPLAGPEIVYASGTGDLDTVRDELARGTTPNKRDVHGITGLMAAARKGHVEIIKLLIRYKARVNARDPKRSTALHFAAQFNHAQAITLLLKAGGKPNAIDKFGSTPMMGAAKNGHLEAVEALLENGADINATDYTGKTAADHARDFRRTAIVRRLREAEKR